MEESRRQRRQRERQEIKIAKASSIESKERVNEFLGFVGFGCGLASWGWSVIAPSSSAVFGSVLLALGVCATVIAILRMLAPGKPASVFVIVVAVLGFAAFDWRVVLKPQQGTPFKTLLVHGYHLASECGSLDGRQQMPLWMRDESKAWQAQVEQLIAEKLAPKDSQLWQAAIIIGSVTDENTVAYQCMWLGNKVGALETIVSTEYDSELKRRDYNGPTFWFEPINGKVDVSEAFKGGRQVTNIAIENTGKEVKKPEGKTPNKP